MCEFKESFNGYPIQFTPYLLFDGIQTQLSMMKKYYNYEPKEEILIDVVIFNTTTLLPINRYINLKEFVYNNYHFCYFYRSCKFPTLNMKYFSDLHIAFFVQVANIQVLKSYRILVSQGIKYSIRIHKNFI